LFESALPILFIVAVLIYTSGSSIV
jgi:hypothetical protein